MINLKSNLIVFKSTFLFIFLVSHVNISKVVRLNKIMNLCKIFCILLVFSLALVSGQDLGDDDEFAEFEDFEESDSNFVEEETASETLSNEQFTPPPSEKIMVAQDDLDDEVSYVFFCIYFF